MTTLPVTDVDKRNATSRKRYKRATVRHHIVVAASMAIAVYFFIPSTMAITQYPNEMFVILLLVLSVACSLIVLVINTKFLFRVTGGIVAIMSLLVGYVAVMRFSGETALEYDLVTAEGLHPIVFVAIALHLLGRSMELFGLEPVASVGEADKPESDQETSEPTDHYTHFADDHTGEIWLQLSHVEGDKS